MVFIASETAISLAGNDSVAHRINVYKMFYCQLPCSVLVNCIMKIHKQGPPTLFVPSITFRGILYTGSEHGILIEGEPPVILGANLASNPTEWMQISISGAYPVECIEETPQLDGATEQLVAKTAQFVH